MGAVPVPPALPPWMHASKSAPCASERVRRRWATTVGYGRTWGWDGERGREACAVEESSREDSPDRVYVGKGESGGLRKGWDGDEWAPPRALIWLASRARKQVRCYCKDRKEELDENIAYMLCFAGMMKCSSRVE